MYIFIDESGVHKQSGKSSVVMIYVLVKEVKNLEQAVLRAEKELKISAFHWSRHIWKIRYNFINFLVKENFQVKAAIVKNPFNEEKFVWALEALLTEKRIKKIIMRLEKNRARRHLVSTIFS